MNRDIAVIFRARKWLIWAFIFGSFFLIGAINDLVKYLKCH